MSDINIQQIPDAPLGYDLTGKKIMVHDQSAPIATGTVLILATSLGGGGGGGSGYSAPIWTVDGAFGSPVAGANTFTSALLIGATNINFIIVNKVIEFITDDYTFNPVIGRITRNNIWQTGDRMVTPFKPL